MEELYRQYSQIVFHFLYARCRDPSLAEDLVQETFLKALESVNGYDGS
ncbi:MAG: RNA polymerase subunit sigma, partial [Lachnospiraceae bacterium]|nr:RNA polymerase subunit sigma [Lachnospiraceae bacterium]